MNIRNFSIIAHIDHGKSTLADRFLDVAGTLDKRFMKDQTLDMMELEKERGITIKMTPVRLNYKLKGVDYVLNLIDTPGHIDFAYEVSRALKAVEGTLLLVDGTQGIQAQTLSTLEMAKNSDLKIIPVITKTDSPLSRIDDVKMQIMELLSCKESDIKLVSGKTGDGVPALLEKIIEEVPPPQENSAEDFRALVFDFEYSNHRGVIVYFRVIDGAIKKGDALKFCTNGESFIASEIGTFSPFKEPRESLSSGEIGYIVTGFKKPGVVRVGDTLVEKNKNSIALPGYEEPRPVVFASLYPESQDDFDELRLSLSKLQLSDSSFTYEEEASGILGRGFRIGFLGMLHLEIITERLRREFNLDIVVTHPSITYKVFTKNNKEGSFISSPHLFPPEGDITRIEEPWIVVTIVVPHEHMNNLMPVLFDHEAEITDTIMFGSGDKTKVIARMPLRELMRGFFDTLKTVTSGYASLSYEIVGWQDANVTRLDILLADELIPAFSRIVSKRKADIEAEKAVEVLHEHMPRQMFETKIQAYANGRIIASRTIKAFRKDVTGYLYGGDVTRKMKLLEKQKKGKKKMKERGKVNIPHEVFVKMIKS